MTAGVVVDHVAPARQAPAPPEAARAVFGSELGRARRYADLLCNEAVTRGLIGPREADRVWSRHLLNCAALAPLIAPQARVMDIGSGAGLPGIPLALARPDLTVTLVEPMLRRVTFLQEACLLLDLNVSVRRARAEELPAAVTDVVVARAVAPLDRLLRSSWPAVAPGGTLLALKGASAAEEIRAARGVLKDLGVHADLVEVPADEPAYVVRVNTVEGVSGSADSATAGAGKRDDRSRSTGDRKRGRR